MEGKALLATYSHSKKILTIMGKTDYAKYIPPLKTKSKQKELERIWDIITKDPEWVEALPKRKIA